MLDRLTALRIAELLRSGATQQILAETAMVEAALRAGAVVTHRATHILGAERWRGWRATGELGVIWTGLVFRRGVSVD